MAHGTDQAIAGLGDGSVIGTGGNVADADNRLASLARVLDIEASEVDVADAGGYTSNVDVESVLQEILGRLPYTIEQSTDVVIDSNSSGGGNGEGATPAATNLVVPVVASKKYLVEACVIVTQTSNGGVELSWTGPSGATMVWGGLIVQGDSNIVQDSAGTENAIGDALNYIAAALNVDPIFIQGILTVDVTAGNLTLLAAQDTGHADNTTIHAESWLRVTPLQ